MAAAIEFHRAAPADVGRLLPLIRAYYAHDQIPYDEVRVRPALTALLARPDWGGVWLVEVDAALTGYFVLTYGFDLELGGRHGTITEMFFTAAHRRRGLGTAATRFVTAHLRAERIGALVLQVARGNERALTFYERIGFDRHDRIPLSLRIDVG